MVQTTEDYPTQCRKNVQVGGMKEVLEGSRPRIGLVAISITDPEAEKTMLGFGGQTRWLSFR